MSLRLHLLNFWFRWREKPALRRLTDPLALRKNLERQAKRVTRGPKGVTSHPDTLTAGGGSIGVRWINHHNRGPVICYIHGGAFVMGSPETHQALAATISHATGLPVCMPRYRLAPEDPFPAAFDDVLAAYCALCDHPGGVILGGDSAGGALALAVLSHALTRGLPAPRACFAFSPLTDMTYSGESHRTNADRDVLLPIEQAARVGEMYLGATDPRDPRASPLFADYPGCPPVWLTVGATEILRDDSVRLFDKLRAQGVQAELSIPGNFPHVWPYFHNLLPEGRDTLAALALWLNAVVSRPADS